ncbi:MAG: hypothetical protein ACK5KO_12085 [Arachnia sp.]
MVLANKGAVQPSSTAAGMAIEIYRDGSIIIAEAPDRGFASTRQAIRYARQAVAAGQPVTVVGALWSPLGRQVAAAVSSAVPGTRVAWAWRGRPKPMLLMDLAFSSDPSARDLRADLMQRARSTRSFGYLVRLASKYARPESAAALRSAGGLPALATPPGSGRGAVTLRYPRRPFIVYLLGLLFVGAVLLIRYAAAGADPAGWAGYVVAVCLGAAVLECVVMAGWWFEVCFDGPLLWTRRVFHRRWRGPFDLTRASAYSELVIAQRCEVVLVMVGDSGEEERLGIPVDRGFLYDGLARYLRRYLPPTCQVRPGSAWERQG